MDKHRNRGSTVGVFTCSCGYVYTRCFNPITYKLGPPRFLRYGPLLEPVLRRLVIAGTHLREVGRTLQLDPKTVVRLAQELGIPVPWKILPARGGRTKSNATMRGVAKRPMPSKSTRSISKQKPSSCTRQDWIAIDRELLTKLSRVVATIRQETPPIRITVAELERRIERRGWLLKRRHHLPNTMAFLVQSVESTEKFQLRRIQWVIRDLEKDGCVKAWEVMRKAGLRSNSLKKINDILDTRDFLHLASR
jgi:hypothetical protein